MFLSIPPIDATPGGLAPPSFCYGATQMSYMIEMLTADMSQEQLVTALAALPCFALCVVFLAGVIAVRP